VNQFTAKDLDLAMQALSYYSKPPLGKYGVVELNTINNLKRTDTSNHFGSIAVIKADDLRACNFNAFIRLIRLLSPRRIPLSIGLICSEIKLLNQHQYSFLSSLNERFIEIWHHGYDHYRNINFLNPFQSNIWEFCNTPFDYQKNHIISGINEAKNILGINLVSFGAPHNKTDINTIRVLQEVPQIEVIFDKAECSGKTMLPSFERVEQFTGRVKPADIFIKSFNPSLKRSEPVVFLIHPEYWDDYDFTEFKKIIDYFYFQLKYSFITPISFSRMRLHSNYSNKV
jgi:hypothetical protein